MLSPQGRALLGRRLVIASLNRAGVADEFLPLPAGFENRRRYVGRYGELAVFHFDFYSVALGKLQRGNEKDYSDVISMVRTKIVELEALETYFDEVLPQIEGYSLRTDPEDFKRKFALFKKRLSEGTQG